MYRARTARVRVFFLVHTLDRQLQERKENLVELDKKWNGLSRTAPLNLYVIFSMSELFFNVALPSLVVSLFHFLPVSDFSHVVALSRDVEKLDEIRRRVNVLPLGRYPFTFKMTLKK